MHPVLRALSRMGVSSEPVAVAIGDQWRPGRGKPWPVHSPVDGSLLASFELATPDDVQLAIAQAGEAFLAWRLVPPPKRGELVRRLGNQLRRFQDDLATIVSWEAGKITAEARGEVQEMIDICDFAVGQSRQLYGRTIATERPGHRMAEQWHPLGSIGVISAFNFPVAVWAWNAMLALVCGDPVIWKPSEKTPLSALACHALAMQVIDETPDIPPGLLSVVVGGADVGQRIAASADVPLVSATGSVPMGRAVAQTVAARLGRSLLELGGNNGMVVAPSADMELAVRSILFAAVGTCGQRCTTLRRLIVHQQIASGLIERLKAAFQRIPIGDPTQEGALMGPLIDRDAFEKMQAALETARKQGGRVYGGQRVEDNLPEAGYYVRPAIVEIDSAAEIVRQETFAPILYVLRYKEFDDAVAMHNNVPQGLSSAILTSNMREAELFCAAAGSDCGIANVNLGTSGAEIGSAFGGEKETGGGRESGSDAWKNYMRRATNTINYSTELPLAQGIRFEI